MALSPREYLVGSKVKEEWNDTHEKFMQLSGTDSHLADIADTLTQRHARPHDRTTHDELKRYDRPRYTKGSHRRFFRFRR